MNNGSHRPFSCLNLERELTCISGEYLGDAMVSTGSEVLETACRACRKHVNLTATPIIANYDYALAA